MNKNRIIIITILFTLLIIFITIISVVNNNKKNNDNKTVKNGSNKEITVQKLEDGTKVNTSNKLSQVKKVGNLEISNSQLTNKDGKTMLLADVKNTGTETINSIELQIILLDQNGNEVKKLNGILGTIKPNETAQLNVASTQDYTNIYDYTIKIK